MPSEGASGMSSQTSLVGTEAGPSSMRCERTACGLHWAGLRCTKSVGVCRSRQTPPIGRYYDNDWFNDRAYVSNRRPLLTAKSWRHGILSLFCRDCGLQYLVHCRTGCPPSYGMLDFARSRQHSRGPVPRHASTLVRISCWLILAGLLFANS
jgi:hypothetical protein